MSNPEKMKVDDTVTEEEKENPDQQRSAGEEPDVREIVLGLPALRISSERFGVSAVGNEVEQEARLNDQAVVAAQLVMAAAEEAVMKERSDGKKKKKKKVSRASKMMSVNDEAGGSGQGAESKKPKKKKGPAFNQIRGPPVCNICGRRFGSWKGVFGHMRCHKDRDYQGYLPPRKFAPIVGGFTIPGPNSAFVLFSAGGGSSGGAFVAGGGGNALGSVAGGAGGAPGGEGGRGLEIDLNDPVEEEEEEEEEMTESGTLAKFDLNKPPPKEEDEEDRVK